MTWVSGLNSDGVVGQLTISQCPCHHMWHGHCPSFAVPGLPFSIGIVRVVKWQWAELMVVDTSGRPIADIVEHRRW